MRRGFTFLLGFLLITTATVVSADDALVVEKDVRKNKKDQGLYLVFCSRESAGTVAPGHAFVVWGKDDEAQQLCSVEAFGFYPEEGLGILGSVPAQIVNEAFKDGTRRETRLIVKVDSNQYKRAHAIREEWANKQFRLVEQDCVSFTVAVAASLDLNRPTRRKGLFPGTFVRNLVELNATSTGATTESH